MSDQPEAKSSTDAFEKALSDKEYYILQLFVSGMTPSSLRAIRNIRDICREHLANRYELEVIDIYQQPELGKAAQIIAAPTLLKKLPKPLQQFIGDLSNTEKILVGLNIVPKVLQKKDDG
jgi:circadian clock protein KaiB